MLDGQTVSRATDGPLTLRQLVSVSSDDAGPRRRREWRRRRTSRFSGAFKRGRLNWQFAQTVRSRTPRISLRASRQKIGLARFNELRVSNNRNSLILITQSTASLFHKDERFTFSTMPKHLTRVGRFWSQVFVNLLQDLYPDGERCVTHY